MAKCCAARGVEIRTDARGARSDRGERPRGRRRDRGGRDGPGETSSSPTSTRSCSSRGSSTRRRCRRIFCGASRTGARGSGTFRMNVALSELPDFACLPGKARAEHHTSGIIIGPSLAYMDRAFLDAKASRLVEGADRRDADPLDARRHAGAAGTACREPLLPARRAGAAGRLPRRQLLGRSQGEGRRPDDRDGQPLRAELQGLGDRRGRCSRRSTSNAPSAFSAATSFMAHLSLDQIFSARPMLGHADYRAPIPGLYMCGSGTHPGGGVTGAPGHNAAREILRDVKAGRKRRLNLRMLRFFQRLNHRNAVRGHLDALLLHVSAEAPVRTRFSRAESDDPRAFRAPACGRPPRRCRSPPASSRASCCS